MSNSLTCEIFNMMCMCKMMCICVLVGEGRFSVAGLK